MTLAAGFNCIDGLYIFADTKHVTGASQFESDKIFDIHDGDRQYLIALAGHTDYGKMVVDVIEENMARCENGARMVALLRDAVTQVFKDHIASVFKAGDRSRPQIEAIVAITGNRRDEKFKPSLWKVVDASTSRIRTFDCVGSGGDIARLYFKWLYPHWEFLPMRIAPVLSGQMIALAHRYDPECGDGFTARGQGNPAARNELENLPEQQYPMTSHFGVVQTHEFGIFALSLREVLLACLDLAISPSLTEVRLKEFRDAVMAAKEADARSIEQYRISTAGHPASGGKPVKR